MDPDGKTCIRNCRIKLVGIQRHDLLAAAVPVVSPLESNGTVFNLKDPVVGNGHPMGIAAKVFHNAGRVFEGRLAVDHPFFVVAQVQQILVKIRYLQFEQRQKLAPKFVGQYPYRKKELLARGLPFTECSHPPRRERYSEYGDESRDSVPRYVKQQ